ncbi:VOC family protein [Phycisphaera mikurensis]|uniref:VOC domain-containing protein n=1 Tax=Phycisphaera mikurensis (strain NBRC 102666 / KCTC 22515 / FYK2301M01) TaxID=1142394 RepID=I0IGD0_PHYMF|nr:VOC family protein [Phycisphaera mikurensis]MBB6440304.1 catechol 2,3-dioxygenase-like lactoylglutathione lyase family enzyme [Phycisphaera mikurensis]BAM04318.1 hypothetical protein PSMK_21590 [Phycisphaera mikurensis NBRC 102666]
MLNLRGVHHTGLTVSNLEAGIAWYRKHLGLQTLEAQWEAPAAGLKIVYLARNGVRVELFENAGAASLPAVGRDHLAFKVDDIEAEVATLRAAGVEITVPPTRVDAASLTYAFFADPDGNKLELVQTDA